VFLQGHPEYEANTLLLEYRRDIRRFLGHERETYPTMAQGYFDKPTVEALAALQRRALADRSEALLEDFTTILARARVTNTWRPGATRMYRNWLFDMWAQKARRLRARQWRRPGRRLLARGKAQPLGFRGSTGWTVGPEPRSSEQ